MPLVRIDLNKSYNAENSKKIGEIIYRAMEQEISVPKDDKFQIITKHDDTELCPKKGVNGTFRKTLAGSGQAESVKRYRR